MSDQSARRVIVDTDTAGDDTQAMLMAATSDRIDLDGVTICAGNVEFDYQVENAKYTLDVAGRANDITVYEGAREPLMKEHEFADYVHGEGGLGGDLFPDTGIPSGDQHAVDFIVETARESPGEVTLACIAPLTNIALALQREPDLNDLVDEVWIMGGNVNCLGNVTPAAEFNFWVDPDAAKIVLDEMDVTLFDWGLTESDTVFDSATLEQFRAYEDQPLGEFYFEATKQVRAWNEDLYGEEMTTQPDSILTASLVEPDIIEASSRYHVEVDEREGLTRGYTAVDENDVTGKPARTEVIETVDTELFTRLFESMLKNGRPEAILEEGA